MPGSNWVVVILCFKCCLPPGWPVVAGQACPQEIVLWFRCEMSPVSHMFEHFVPCHSAILGECEAFGKGRMAGVGPWRGAGF